MQTIEDCDKYILNTYKRFHISFVKGDGVWLYTEDGKKMLDCSSGLAVSSMGHSHPKIIRTIREQSEKLIHTSNLYYSIPCVKLAKMLVERSVFDKVFFCNSGAEANEAAIKLARKYGKSKGNNKKFKIVTLKNSFHGRTMATITMTGQTKYQNGFEPLLQGVSYVEPNNIDELKKSMDKDVCAVVIEVVQGEGGIKIIDSEFIKEVRRLCSEYDALMIIDEIQTGIGRTGKLFGYQNFFDIEPDIITLAKGLAGGMPIGAMLVKEKFSFALGPGEHASTFGGNLITTSVGAAVLEIIDEENILENVVKNGLYFIDKLLNLKSKHSCIVDVRGIGLMIGIEINYSNRDLINKLLEHNIITVPAGENVVRFLPPLIITKNEIDIVINTLDKVL